MRLRPATRAALAAVLGGVLGITALLTAGCGAEHATPPARLVSATEGVFNQVPGADPELTQTSDGTYLTWNASSSEAGLPRMVLARIDTRTGLIQATNTFSQGLLDAPLYADGALWVTDSTSLGELLLRLDPASLMVTGELRLSAAPYPDGSHLAYAGGWLWAAGAGRLLRVSPAALELTGTVPLPGARESAVAASPDGAVLVVTEQGRTAAVQRRNPRTGALLAARAIDGQAAVIDGFTGSGVWVTEIAGTSARAELLSDATMTPADARQVSGRGDLGVLVARGLLWVTDDDAGAAATDYCADAETGRGLSALPVTARGQGELLAVGAGVLYYAEAARHGAGTRIAAAPVPAGCG
jgi:hypothetical protein